MRMAAGIGSGVVGWVLSFTPKDSAPRRLSERMDNLGLRGFMTDEDVRAAYPRNSGARFGFFHGIGNNGVKNAAAQKGGFQTFAQQQINELDKFLLIHQNSMGMTQEEHDRIREIYRDETDFIALYSGNGAADIMLMCFEQSGLGVASRKIMEPYQGVSYERAYFHSAAVGIKKNYEDKILSESAAFVGSAGMQAGSADKYAGDKIQNQLDLVSNMGPVTSGEEMGFRLAARFGGGGNDGIQRKVADGRTDAAKLWEEKRFIRWGLEILKAPSKLADRHSYMDYFVQDQLNKMRHPASTGSGISVKNPDFENKMNERVYGGDR
jgi:hypothetical protein